MMQRMLGYSEIMSFSIVALCFCVLLQFVTTASAQNYEAMMQQNMEQMRALDAQMNAQLLETAARQKAEEAKYLAQNRPALEQEYQQHMQANGMRMSLEEYVHVKILNEAARRNGALNPQPNPIFEQQKRMFDAGQQAHQQRQQNFDSYNQTWSQNQQQIDTNNQGWMQNQRQVDSSHNRFVQQGIQGNQYYRNSETGELAELPFAGDTGVYTNPSGSTWTSDSMGQFNQIGPQGNLQQMQVYEPEYNDE